MTMVSSPAAHLHAVRFMFLLTLLLRRSMSFSLVFGRISKTTMPEMSPQDILPQPRAISGGASLRYTSAHSEVARRLTLVITTLASFRPYPNTFYSLPSSSAVQPTITLSRL